MLTAHVDDSGSDETDSVIVLAGFAASIDVWEKFSQAWAGVLSAAPRIAYFKFNEAKTRNKQFKGFSVAQRDAKIGNLSAVITDNRDRLFKMRCTIGWADYKSSVKGRLFSKSYDHPYFLAFYNIIFSWAAFQLSCSMLEETDFIFDDQGKLGRKTRSFYAKQRKLFGGETRRRVGPEPIFEDDKRVLPLQAADLYAGLSHDYACGQHLLIGTEMREPLISLNKIKGPDMRLTKDDLDTLVLKSLKEMYPLTCPH